MAVAVVVVIVAEALAAVAVASAEASEEASVAVADAGSDTCLHYYIEKTSQTPLTEICEVFFISVSCQ